jgi:hypothetical protein
MAAGAHPLAFLGGGMRSAFRSLAMRVTPRPAAQSSKIRRTTAASSGLTRRTTWRRTGRPSGPGVAANTSMLS